MYCILLCTHPLACSVTLGVCCRMLYKSRAMVYLVQSPDSEDLCGTMPIQEDEARMITFVSLWLFFQGCKLKFCTPIASCSQAYPISILTGGLNGCCAQGIVAPVLTEHFQGFYLSLFTVLKPNGGVSSSSGPNRYQLVPVGSNISHRKFKVSK